MHAARRSRVTLRARARASDGLEDLIGTLDPTFLSLCSAGRVRAIPRERRLHRRSCRTGKVREYLVVICGPEEFLFPVEPRSIEQVCDRRVSEPGAKQGLA